MLVFGAICFTTTSASANTVDVIHNPCDAFLQQVLASVNPNVTKTLAGTAYQGANRCSNMTVRAFIQLFSTMTEYVKSGYDQGSTYYVWAPNSSGAYGNAAFGQHQPWGYCAAVLEVFDGSYNFITNGV